MEIVSIFDAFLEKVEILDFFVIKSSFGFSDRQIPR